MSIEQTIAALLSEINRQTAEIRANETTRVASENRLDAALKAEATATASLQQVTADLEKAKKELTEIQRTTNKIQSDTTKERDRILSKAHQEAAQIVEQAEQAVDAAANLIKRKPAA
jgi:hypothetical protein